MTSGIEELVEAFRRDPSDADAFAALRRAYQAESRLEELGALLERRAAHIHDPQKSADLLVQAAETYQRLPDRRAEKRALRRALELCKSHPRALERLKAIYFEDGLWLDYLELLEAEIGVLDRGDAARVARLEHECATLWEQHFQRLDRAIAHYQRAFKADPTQLESIEAGRRVYGEMGHWKTVASLYQVELSTCNDAKRRVDLLLKLAKLLWDRTGDLEAAARCYNEALQHRPGDEAIQELMADLYASPEWPSPGGQQKAAAIALQIAQRRQSRGDRDGAIPYLRRALTADPESEAASTSLERAYEETGRWEELERLIRQRLSVVTGPQAAALQLRRAELLEKKLGDRKGARECYEALMGQERVGGPATARLIELCRAEGDWTRVAELTRRTLEVATDYPTRIRLLMELATIERDQLGDPEAAALYLHEVLQLDPGHRKAIAAYEDYFRQKGDYRNLAELLRFAAQAATASGAPALEICARLEELADVSERRLGDLMGAIEAWQQIAEIHPDTQRSQEMLGRLAGKYRIWEGTVQMLERELEAAATPVERLQVLQRMAQLYGEKRADPQRTMDVLREILGYSPQDEHALRMFVELTEREGDHTGLAWALERQLSGILTKPERVAVLRRLSELYCDKLGRPKEGLAALNLLLELAPSDGKVQERIQVLLEQAGDIQQLARVLEYRAQTSRSLTDRLAALKSLARMMDDRLQNPGRAAAYWEEVRQLDPDDTDSLECLTRIYERTGRNAELLAVLQRRLALTPENATGPRVAILRQLATVADERLGLADEAARAYEQLSSMLPADREMLDALARLYTRLDRHQDLVRVLGRVIELCNDPEQSVALAFKQGDILEERLRDLDGAALIFEHIITDYSPSDLDAHRRLKELHLRRGDYRRACDIAERELFLTGNDLAERRSLALQIASLWRDKIKDDQRAIAGYERVLELSADNADALCALRRLYHRTGNHAKLVRIAPSLFGIIPDDREREILLIEVGQVFEEQLHDPSSAFEWYRRAYDLYPGDGVALGHLQRMARAHGLWEDLLATYGEARRRADSAQQVLALHRDMATICDQELHDPGRAFDLVRQAQRAADSAGQDILPELERLGEAAGRFAELLDIYDQALLTRADREERRGLLLRRAAVAEDRAHHPSAALDSMLQLAEANPEDRAVVDQVDRLARLSGRWEDALQLHARIYRTAPDTAARLAILRHVAGLMEQQMGDRVRAFRTQLSAFALCPSERSTVGELWRLASLLPTSEVPAAPRSAAPRPSERKSKRPVVEVSEGMVIEEEHVADGGRLVIESTKPRREDGTIDDPTLTEVLPGSAPPPPVRPAPPPPPPPAPRRQDDGPEEVFGSSAPMASPWAELAEAYRALPKPDPQTRIAHLLSVADLWARGAKQVDQALDTLAEAAAIDPLHPRLQERLAQLAKDHDRFERMLEIYLDAVERAADADSLITLHLKVAEMLLAQGRQSEAEQHLGAVLAVRPDQEFAAHLLRELYQADNRWEDLARLLDRQLDVLAESLGRVGRAQRLHELADLYQHTMNRPFETVDYLIRLVAEQPEDIALQLRLADLYEDLSIWPRLVEVLQELLRRAEDRATRITHLLRMGRVFEEELELPDRAIEAYRAVLVEDPHQPNALQALDRLYEAHQRRRELIDILRLRVALAADDATLKRILLVRLARALESDEVPRLDEAAECLEQARALGPFDPAIDEALGQVLVQSGKTGAAIALLRARIATVREQGQPELQVSLLVRLAQLQLKELGDPEAARSSLEDALAVQPRNREVLEALSSFFAARGQWADYLESSERFAGALSDPEERTDVLLRTAQVARDRLSDEDRCRRLLEETIQISPSSLPAIDGLLGLTSLDLERRESLLRLKLELVNDPREKAKALSELARALELRGAPADAASALQRQALTLDPECLPALDGLSALLVAQQRLDPARALLQDALSRDGARLNRDTGPLYLRLGRIFEQLDRSDEGYEYLKQALRFDPESVLLHISLGQNRFRGGLWREALRHLQVVAEHAAAVDHPIEAAEALFAAGQCESMLRRPERAAAQFEAALRLNPHHLASLRALAQTAFEASQWRRAAELTEKLLSVLSDSEERAPLLRRAAEIYLDRLQDEESAARCYVELLDYLPNDEATRLSVLPRMIPVLKATGRHRTLAQVAESLSSLLSSGAEIRDMLLLAAQEWQAAGSSDIAEKHLSSVLQLDPTSLAAVEAVVEIQLAGERRGEVVALLQQFLAQLPGELTVEDRPRYARLLATLGQALRQQGDALGAIGALERSLALEEDLVLREILADLYEGYPELADADLQNHRRLLLAAPGRTASLRALARVAATENAYRAHCYYQTLAALGQIDEEGRAFLASHPVPESACDDPFPGEITEEDRRALLTVGETPSMSEAFSLIWEAAPALLTRDLSLHGVGSSDRVSPLDDTPLARVFGACSRALGIKQTALYSRRSEAGLEMQLLAMAPPSIIVGPQLAKRTPAELRFLVGRAVELSHQSYILAAGLDRTEFARLFSSVLRAFHPRHMRGRRDLGPEAAQQANQLRKSIPFKIARRLSEIFREKQSVQFDSGKWRQSVLLSGNRAGLALCGDVQTAIRLLLEENASLREAPPAALPQVSPILKDLLAFAASDSYYLCRVKLGVATLG